MSSDSPVTELDGPDTKPHPVVSLRFASDSFANSWLHCQQVADFVARVAASDRYEAEHHATLLSHFLNELLELVFRLHATSREIHVSVYKIGDELQVELKIPIDEETEQNYQQLFSTLGEGNSREFLRKHIQKIPSKEPGGETAFYELAGIYNMKLDLRTEEQERTLILSMPVNFG